MVSRIASLTSSMKASLRLMKKLTSTSFISSIVKWLSPSNTNESGQVRSGWVSIRNLKSATGIPLSTALNICSTCSFGVFLLSHFASKDLRNSSATELIFCESTLIGTVVVRDLLVAYRERKLITRKSKRQSPTVSYLSATLTAVSHEVVRMGRGKEKLFNLFARQPSIYVDVDSIDNRIHLV
jgi:hypothetical protein